MNLRVALMGLVLLWAQDIRAQNKTSYIQPEYKIRLRDTTGTYIQVINYFDRSNYTRDIYLKKELDDKSASYTAVRIDTNTGIGIIPKLSNTPIHLQVNKTLEIPNLTLQKNKVNRIEVRSEGGFLSLPYRWGKTHVTVIKGKLTNAYDSSEIKLTIPGKLEVPKGKYILSLNTIPKFTRTVYLKPSTIFYSPIYRSIPLQILNANKYGDYKLYYASYPYKDYKICKKGNFSKKGFETYLQPKKLYEIHYRKKGKRRYKKKKFYMDISMDVFIMELD